MCTLNLFDYLAPGIITSGTWYSTYVSQGHPSNVVIATPSALDFNDATYPTGIYTFTYELCITCNMITTCDTMELEIDSYDLVDPGNQEYCEDDATVITIIGGPGALIEGDLVDFTLTNPFGNANTFQPSVLGAGTYPITAVYNPSQGGPCPCQAVFTLEIEALPMISLGVTEFIGCTSCTGSTTYDLTSILSGTGITWWTSLASSPTCDSITTNAGVPSGVAVPIPSAAPLSTGENTFIVAKAITGGGCGDVYVCQEVTIWGVPEVMTSDIAFTIADDFCTCTFGYDVDIDNSNNCFADFYDQLVVDGGVVTPAASGFGSRVTHSSGMFAEYQWDLEDSGGSSVLSSPTVTEIDFDTDCSEVDNLPADTYTMSYRAITGYGITQCSDVIEEEDIVHTGCCCIYTINKLEPGTSTPMANDELYLTVIDNGTLSNLRFELTGEVDLELRDCNNNLIDTAQLSGTMRRDYCQSIVLPAISGAGGYIDTLDIWDFTTNGFVTADLSTVIFVNDAQFETDIEARFATLYGSEIEVSVQSTVSSVIIRTCPHDDADLKHFISSGTFAYDMYPDGVTQDTGTVQPENTPSATPLNSLSHTFNVPCGTITYESGAILNDSNYSWEDNSHVASGAIDIGPNEPANENSKECCT